MCHQFCVNLTTNHKIHGEKNHVSQQCTSYASAVRKVLQMDFPESRDIPSLPSMGAPHRNRELSKQ